MTDKKIITEASETAASQLLLIESIERLKEDRLILQDCIEKLRATERKLLESQNDLEIKLKGY